MSEVVADDLDDGLEYEVEEEDQTSLAVPIEDDEEKEVEVQSAGKKRKLNDKLQNKKRMKMEFDSEQKKNLSLESADAIEEALAKKIARGNKDLSPLELAELYISKKHIKASSDFKENRTLDNLSLFLKQKYNDLVIVQEAGKKKKKRNPKRQDKVATELAKKLAEKEDIKKFVVVLSMSAIRACDIFRATRDFKSVKLIKKNKLKDDLNVLQETSSRVLATTPGRIIKIMSEPDCPISAKNIAVIVLDSTYLDTKKQNVLDVAETLTFMRQICSENEDLIITLY